jgi:hypothetical protein
MASPGWKWRGAAIRHTPAGEIDDVVVDDAILQCTGIHTIPTGLADNHAIVQGAAVSTSWR